MYTMLYIKYIQLKKRKVPHILLLNNYLQMNHFWMNPTVTCRIQVTDLYWVTNFIQDKESSA